MTTTPNYGGVLPTVGGDSGTWGTENNTLHSLWDSTIFSVATLVSGAQRAMLAGLTLSTAGSSATFTVQAGAAADSTNTTVMVLASSLTKTTSAWAVGAAAGALDTGSIANSTWYHVYLIKRVDTNVVDLVISLSASAPTLPTNYTLYRRIGAMKTDASAKWTAFTQFGDKFLWTAAVADFTASGIGSSPVTFALSVPTGLNVEALFNFSYSNNAGVTSWLYFNSVAQTSVAADIAHAQVNYNSGLANYVSGAMQITTDNFGQVRGIASIGTGSAVYITTQGWIDRRGRDA